MFSCVVLCSLILVPVFHAVYGNSTTHVPCGSPPAGIIPGHPVSNVEEPLPGANVCASSMVEMVQEVVWLCDMLPCCQLPCHCLAEHISEAACGQQPLEHINCYVQQNLPLRFYRRICCPGYVMTQYRECVAISTYPTSTTEGIKVSTSTAMYTTPTTTTTSSFPILIDRVEVDAIYPLNAAYGGRDIHGLYNEIQFINTQFADGPLGCPKGAVALAGDESSYLFINNTDKKLTYGPKSSMSFFVYLNHNKTYNPILEYGFPGRVHPDVHLHFHTYWHNINGLYFNLGDGSVRNPWIGVGNVITPNTWSHVGFTYNDGPHMFKMWVNGTAVTQQLIPQGLGTNTLAAEVLLGVRRGYAALGGKLSCAAFFEKELGEREVEDLMRQCQELECEPMSGTKPPGSWGVVDDSPVLYEGSGVAVGTVIGVAVPVVLLLLILLAVFLLHRHCLKKQPAVPQETLNVAYTNETYDVLSAPPEEPLPAKVFPTDLPTKYEKKHPPENLYDNNACAAWGTDAPPPYSEKACTDKNLCDIGPDPEYFNEKPPLNDQHYSTLDEVKGTADYKKANRYRVSSGVGGQNCLPQVSSSPIRFAKYSDEPEVHATKTNMESVLTGQHTDLVTVEQNNVNELNEEIYYEIH